MSKEQLKHIFEHSACLTPKQLRGYATGKMVHEEAHAVEVHLLSCPFCSDAIAGISKHSDTAVKNLDKIDASFIATHFGVTKDEVKINTKSARKTKQTAFKSLEDASGAKTKSTKVWKPIAAAAGLVGIAVIMWMMKDSIFPEGKPDKIAQEEVIPQEQANPEPTIAYKPTTEDSTLTTDMEITAGAEELEETNIGEEVAKRDQLGALTPPDDASKKELADKKLKENKDNTELAAAKLAEQKAQQKKKEPIVADNTPAVTKKAAADVEQRPRMGNSFNAADVNEYSAKPKEEAKKEKAAEAAPPPPPPKKEIQLGTARSGILKGDEAFNDGKYKKALKQYQKVMYDPESNQKDAATLMAAKCHIAMEEMMQARTLLNSLIKDNSTKKSEAAGLLNQVPKE